MVSSSRRRRKVLTMASKASQDRAARPLPPYTTRSSGRSATSGSRLFINMRSAASCGQPWQLRSVPRGARTARGPAMTLITALNSWGWGQDLSHTQANGWRMLRAVERCLFFAGIAALAISLTIAPSVAGTTGSITGTVACARHVHDHRDEARLRHLDDHRRHRVRRSIANAAPRDQSIVTYHRAGNR